ncbi:MAG: carboxypeptidase-like regulatory domain-containing protein, partial [Bacteroidales bacterium]
MLKQLKSVSSILLALGACPGLTFAASDPGTTTMAVAQQEAACTGIVKDPTGESIIGASVIVKGTTNGTITGIDGDFSLTNVKKGDIIVVSYIGFQTQEFAWDGKPVNVMLKDDTQKLDEVVVVAFGTQKKVNVTGAVSTVDAKELSSRPVNSTVDALQGVVPGMNISTGSAGGSLSGNKKFNIRGIGSIGS